MRAAGEIESEQPASEPELDATGAPAGSIPKPDAARADRNNEAFALIIVGALAAGIVVALPVLVLMLAASADSSAEEEAESVAMRPFLIAAFTAGVAIGIVAALAAVAVLRLAEKGRSLPNWGAVVVASSTTGLVTFLLLGLPALVSPLVPALALVVLFATAFGVQLYPLFILVAALAAALVVARFRREEADAQPSALAASLGESAPPAPRQRSLAGRFAASAVLVALGTLVFNFFWVAQLPSWNVREDCARLGAGGGEFTGIEWSWFPAQTVCDKDGAALAVVPPWVALVLGFGLFAALALALLSVVVATRLAVDSVPVAVRRTVVESRAALVLAVIGIVSPLWMALIHGALSSAWVKPSPERMVYYAAQLGVAALIPVLALGIAWLSIAAARRVARSRRAADAAAPGTDPVAAEHDERRVAGRAASLAAIALVIAVGTLGATLSVGLGRMSELQQSIEAQQRLDSLPSVPPAPLDGTNPGGAGTAEPPAPAAPSAAMTPDEARASMSMLIAETVDAATRGASELRWIDASGATSSTGNDAFPAVSAPAEPAETSCLEGAGVRYDLASASFAVGTITDTSSEENDVEVTEANIAAADRIIARWESLGYVEDSGLGGNFELYGTAESAASVLTARFDFGTATIAAEGLCVAR